MKTKSIKHTSRLQILKVQYHQQSLHLNIFPAIKLYRKPPIMLMLPDPVSFLIAFMLLCSRNPCNDRYTRSSVSTYEAPFTPRQSSYSLDTLLPRKNIAKHHRLRSDLGPTCQTSLRPKLGDQGKGKGYKEIATE